MKHRYLFTLEIATLDVGRVYDELPSHLTLMSRFFSALPYEQLSEAARRLFVETKPFNILFGDPIEIGPKSLTVHTVQHSDTLVQLHAALRALLDARQVEYEYPQYIGKNHIPHVTKRQNVQLEPGSSKLIEAVYLIEIIEGNRIVRSKLALKTPVRSSKP